jgi:hypothetical protein
MGYAYTPGLAVSECTVVRKVRRLPLPGRVLVQVGQPVEADDVVAETSLPGEVKSLNLASKLGIAPEELPEAMLRQEGQPVAENELLARTKGLFGLFRSEARSPMEGCVESISQVTGQVIIRGKPTALRKTAYARGVIVAVQEAESATVEVRGTFIQGIFGIGGEAQGELAAVVDCPDAVLDTDLIQPELAGKIVVGGSLVTADAVRAAVRCGVRGIITGGLNDADLRDFLGYELGVAITGEESLGLTLIVTEGFGRISMAQATFELLRKRAGHLASINGATQIRAGVIRPEVLIPLAPDRRKVCRGLPDRPTTADPSRGSHAAVTPDTEVRRYRGARASRPPAERFEEDIGLRIGTPLRAIRDPYFGRIGRCTALPVELARLPTETQVRVLEVEFEDGERAVLPRANVELIKQ